jgi:hypothetical protein
LPIKQDKTLFNTGAETHIAKSIDDFTAGTYTPASLSAIDTASKEARPLGFGKRTLICATNTDEETHILNLSKVLYLLNCGINIFKAKKLLDKGNIRIKDKNLIINREGLNIFRFDKNIIIIKASQTYAFFTVTQKPTKTLIRLWHRRFSYLSLNNIQKTLKIVKGIKLKKDEFVN